MIVLAIVAVIAFILMLVGFLAGIAYFIGWVWSSISNDNDYGVAHETKRSKR